MTAPVSLDLAGIRARAEEYLSVRYSEVLALVDEVERLTRERDEAREQDRWSRDMLTGMETLATEATKLRARVAELEGK